MEYFSPGSQDGNTNKVRHLGFKKAIKGELEQQLKDSQSSGLLLLKHVSSTPV